jgi:hypothetical protein
MTNLQKGLQREIASFSEAILSDGGSIPEVSKSAFCRARKKLKHTAFVELSELVGREFYESEEAEYWNGFRLLGVDGSTAALPNSEEIRQQYGVHSYREDGKAVSVARTLLVYDTINHLTLHGAMDRFDKPEVGMLWDCLPTLDLQSNDLMIFDRLYASHLLMLYLNQRGVSFCFRMKKNWWKEVEAFYNSGESSKEIRLSLPLHERERAAALGITQIRMRCRLVRVELEGGETEILLTSLTDEKRYPQQAIKSLYSWRWPVEEGYKTFKHKVCIENFSGKSPKAVLQDFHVKLFIMNLTAAAIKPLNEALKKKPVKVKYRHQVNVIEAIATLKRAVVSFFLTDKASTAIDRFYTRMAKITEPIRPNRKYDRNHRPKRKYYMNYKPV